MNPKRLLNSPRSVMSIGMVFMILAGLSRWFLPRLGVSEGSADATTGFLYGVTIALLLSSMVLRRKQGTGRPL